jgi:hypothetical protein
MSYSRDFLALQKAVVGSLPEPLSVEEVVGMLIQSTLETDGATVSLYWGDMSGKPFWAVALFPERTESYVIGLENLKQVDGFRRLATDFLKANAELLRVPTLALGVWFNSDMKTITFDVSAFTSKIDAIELGTLYNQEAVASLSEGGVYQSTGGSGEVKEDARWLSLHLRAPLCGLIG